MAHELLHSPSRIKGSFGVIRRGERWSACRPLGALSAGYGAPVALRPCDPTGKTPSAVTLIVTPTAQPATTTEVTTRTAQRVPVITYGDSPIQEAAP
ncbi:hypothetical protein DXZ75_18805 [Streptomyces sp. AcE210]|nr:hypothetical protein DXZ75_18805 [Streptomyces sp. AcE210]